MNANEFISKCKFPVFFYAGNGAPGGQSIAIFEEDYTTLPVELEELTGEVEGGIFEADNLTSGPTAKDWKFSDFAGNLIYKIQIFDDETIWKRQRSEWESAA